MPINFKTTDFKPEVAERTSMFDLHTCQEETDQYIQAVVLKETNKVIGFIRHVTVTCIE